MSSDFIQISSNFNRICFQMFSTFQHFLKKKHHRGRPMPAVGGTLGSKVAWHCRRFRAGEKKHRRLWNALDVHKTYQNITKQYKTYQNMGPTIKSGGFTKLTPILICIKWGGFTKLTPILICIKWGGFTKLTPIFICIKWGGFMSISPWYLGIPPLHSVGWVRAVIL